MVYCNHCGKYYTNKYFTKHKQINKYRYYSNTNNYEIHVNESKMYFDTPGEHHISDSQVFELSKKHKGTPFLKSQQTVIIVLG